jgi:hypothetical protein
MARNCADQYINPRTDSDPDAVQNKQWQTVDVAPAGG